MDPPGMMNHGSYNLEEIWQFPINGSGRGHHQFGQFCGDDLEQQRGGGILTAAAAAASTRKRRDVVSVDDDSTKTVSTSNADANTNTNTNGMSECDGKRLKTSGSRVKNHDSKGEAERSSGKHVEQQKAQTPEPSKQDYIHVRARRGQATDSHSLAERARREKISERMKILQDLVPGCNKVIGKALVLDEIINYIQSLQRQVEFLSMKLEAVNSRMTPGIEVFPSKDFGQQSFDTAGMAFGSQATREYSRGTSPEWLHMQLGGGFERTS